MSRGGRSRRRRPRSWPCCRSGAGSLWRDMHLWLAADPLVLASNSATRRTMLEAAGIPVEVHPADIDERVIEAAAGAAEPGEVAALLARAKAKAVAAQKP